MKFIFNFVKPNKALSKDLPPLKDEILKYSRYTSYWGIFTWVYLSSDKWLIEYFFGGEEVAAFVVLLQLGYYPMSLISGILNQFLAPIFFEKINNLNKDTFYFDNLNKKLVVAILILTLIISVFVFFSHEYIFEIFTSRSKHK